MGLFAARAGQGPDPRSLHGAPRVAAAVVILQQVAAEPQRIPNIWERWELPLLEVLPDCPPGMKSTLSEALDSCAKACRHRDTARRIITLRNGLLS